MKFKVVLRTLYSPDLAPLDFNLLQNLGKLLAWKKYGSLDESIFLKEIM